jgi:uncharacterized protein (TIGR04141 family)
MPRQEAKANKVSLYRLVPPSNDVLAGCLQQKYLDSGFEVDNVPVATSAGLLVTGVIPNPFPKWLPHVMSLTGRSPNVHNDTAAAVLLVPFRDYVYALCWGFGHLILSPSFIDSGFGLRFAIRRASPRQVRSLTIHTMDTLARTARTTVPGGATLQSFGMEEIGELVSRLVGRVPATGLTGARGGDNDFITVRGADGLSIPLARDPDGMLADIEYLHDVVEHEQPVEGLEHFEHTKPLRPQDPVLHRLKERLAEVLTPGSPRVALSWPAEWDEEHGEATSYVLQNLGRGDWEDSPEELELDHLILPVAGRDPDKRLAALKRIKVQALDSDGQALSREIAGDRWITSEIDLDGQRYVFHQGRWFNIGGAYLDMLDDRMRRIFAVKSGLRLPDWPREKKKDGTIGRAAEGSYNEHAAKIDGDLVCLDRKLIRTQQHPRGFESCDLFGPNGELIHVKRLDDSVSASHLFSQALVSAEALRSQPDAKSGLRQAIVERSNGTRDLPIDYRPRKVVLAFGGREATPEALFTFSQVTLNRCAKRLGEMDIELEIAEIKYSDEVLTSDDDGN